MSSMLLTNDPYILIRLLYTVYHRSQGYGRYGRGDVHATLLESAGYFGPPSETRE